MSKPLALASRWVLVTGASSGLGLEMARVLARVHRANLVLVARRRERLDALAAELQRDCGVQALAVAADLAEGGAAERVLAQATAEGRTLSAVVLNAGVTFYGEALAQEPAQLEALVRTNVLGMVDLASRAARHMVQAREPGALLMVSSVGGLMPLPYQAAYGASKAFVTSYGLSLGEELRAHGVSVTVFAPGGIATELLELSGLDAKFKAGQVGVMEAPACAERAVAALVSRRALVVPGLLNQALAAAPRLLPRRFLAARVAALYRPSR
ncbi:SDR family NAD(P)-dependent oxidoreductase [Aggregicoccus sp. 17bor-14]|uniref:SDR family NAD(P)-dependent oxidoreductase n=1 Tax=Myxococcaceae TaxID=31 RepID=UPI00129C3275|nr:MULTISPECIES: SDR family NAD(P)-dependent oxidoreductase [Myxococcaceae]MBF5043354.1 SDR family NAD(P)-dependent oxidoreductase [Simulacricoccus sp. 17bor-14]MRI89113.1 SDR family NAD(P)-dependent oxidoreductase [Aggregicoccus sp. 17bor-14]